jgi:uncharacterized membrane protein YbjE (DUF340 family)
MWGISWPATNLLVPQEGLCYIELLSKYIRVYIYIYIYIVYKEYVLRKQFPEVCHKRWPKLVTGLQRLECNSHISMCTSCFSFIVISNTCYKSKAGKETILEFIIKQCQTADRHFYVEVKLGLNRTKLLAKLAFSFKYSVLFCLLFFMGVQLGFSHGKRNIDWRCSR